MKTASDIRLRGFRDFLVSQAVLLLNAGTLALGTLCTAVLGFVYWWFAARAFPAEAVGLAAAAVSLMNLLAHLGEVGLGPFLLGEISRQKRLGPFLAGALVLAICATLVVTAIYLVVARHASIQLGAITGSLRTDAFFAAGCALTVLTLVLDQAFVGLLRSGLQLVRNIVFATEKLLFLVILGFIVGQKADESDIYATWVSGQAFSLLIVAALLLFAGNRVFHRPEIRALRPLLTHVFGHHALSIAVQAPGLLLPFAVTVILSAEVNAAFYAAWTLLNVALLIPASLSAVLFSVAVREPDLFATRLRLSLGLSIAIGLATAIVFLFLSRFMLWVFNPSYAEIVGYGLQYLGFGAVGMAVKYHYLAVQRVRNKLGPATFVLIGGAGLEICAAVVGGRMGGIGGLANMWVGAVLVEALLLLPAVWAAARRRSPYSASTSSLPRMELEGQAQASLEQSHVAIAGAT